MLRVLNLHKYRDMSSISSYSSVFSKQLPSRGVGRSIAQADNNVSVRREEWRFCSNRNLDAAKRAVVRATCHTATAVDLRGKSHKVRHSSGQTDTAYRYHKSWRCMTIGILLQGVDDLRCWHPSGLVCEVYRRFRAQRSRHASFHHELSKRQMPIKPPKVLRGRQ